MDATTQRLIQAIEAYKEVNGRVVPEKLLDAVTEVQTMIEAPKYGPESPGEMESREVAEEATNQLDMFDSALPS